MALLKLPVDTNKSMYESSNEYCNLNKPILPPRVKDSVAKTSYSDSHLKGLEKAIDSYCNYENVSKSSLPGEYDTPVQQIPSFSNPSYTPIFSQHNHYEKAFPNDVENQYILPIDGKRPNNEDSEYLTREDLGHPPPGYVALCPNTTIPTYTPLKKVDIKTSYLLLNTGTLENTGTESNTYTSGAENAEITAPTIS